MRKHLSTHEGVEIILRGQIKYKGCQQVCTFHFAFCFYQSVCSLSIVLGQLTGALFIAVHYMGVKK